VTRSRERAISQERMATASRKRPWYLRLALVGALALGATGASDGWNAMTLYHEAIDPSLEGDGIADEADRVAVVARARAWVQALDHAEPRGWPLSVAEFLLGGAVFAFALRTLGGGAGARALLVQLLAIQAATNVASCWLTRDVSDARDRMFEARHLALREASAGDSEHLDPAMRDPTAVMNNLTPILIGLELGFQTLASALVIAGLTGRRARKFLDSGAETVEER
jgi:hypothetical protein